MTTPARPSAREADIQRAILDWLAAERIWHIRLNTGAFGGVHNGKRRFVRFGRPGMADILVVFCRCVYSGHVNCASATERVITWIEVKGPKGVQSNEQKRFQKECLENGMNYILARSLDDVIEVLK